jgi:hypothetical protein
VNLNHEQQTLQQAVERLIDNACNYRLDVLEGLYSTDLVIVTVAPDGQTTRLNYEQNMQFFRAKRDSGALPLETTAVFNYVEVDGIAGYVVVTRHVNLTGARQKIVFNLTLSRASGNWTVIREFAVIIGET